MPETDRSKHEGRVDKPAITRPIYLGFVVLLASALVARAQQPPGVPATPPTLRAVDVFGTTLFSGEDVAKEFPSDIASLAKAFSAFPPDVDLTRSATERIERGLRSRGSFVYLDVNTTYGPPPDNGLYVMVDVVETLDARRRMPFRDAPTGASSDPGGLLARWAEYQDKVFELMFSGTSLVVSSCPVLHCLAPFTVPELAPYLQVFNEGARKHEKALYDIAVRDRDKEHRAAALFLLAHTSNAKTLLPVLGRAMHDPDVTVRNNAMRIMGWMASTDADLDYPVKDVIAALEFPAADDRNKSAWVLTSLVKSTRYRQTIRRQAVPSLLKLLRLQQANNHDPAYDILKELSGKQFGDRDYDAWERWFDSARRSASW